MVLPIVRGGIADWVLVGRAVVCLFFTWGHWDGSILIRQGVLWMISARKRQLQGQYCSLAFTPSVEGREAKEFFFETVVEYILHGFKEAREPPTSGSNPFIPSSQYFSSAVCVHSHNSPGSFLFDLGLLWVFVRTPTGSYNSPLIRFVLSPAAAHSKL